MKTYTAVVRRKIVHCAFVTIQARNQAEAMDKLLAMKPKAMGFEFDCTETLLPVPRIVRK